MAYTHHGSIRKYTAALLDVFNDLEVQYKKSTGESVASKIPMRYSTREKSRILDDYSVEQILSGNHNVLPRSSISLVGMQKATGRVMNKNHKIGRFKGNSIEFMFNSVPYEFSYEINFQCRGMNEATQIIEQVTPIFNPILSVDVWDAANLSEPTRVPVKLEDISVEIEDYEELSTNIANVTLSLSVVGNLYPPIQEMPSILEFSMRLNQIEDAQAASMKKMLTWDVDHEGKVISDTFTSYAEYGVEAFTTEKLQIIDNQISLPYQAVGDIIFNYGMIFADLGTSSFQEVTCTVSADGYSVIFDPADGVEGKFAVVTFFVETKDDFSYYPDSSGLEIPRDVRVSTTDRLLINNNKVTLPYQALGDVILNYALVYPGLKARGFSEATCAVQEDGYTVNFSPSDDVNNRYAVISFIKAS